MAHGLTTAGGAVRLTGFMEYVAVPSSFRLRARELDHLGPLLGFFDDEYSELARRAAEHRRAQIGKPRLYLGVRKNGVHLLVEAADDLRGRIL